MNNKIVLNQNQIRSIYYNELNAAMISFLNQYKLPIAAEKDLNLIARHLSKKGSRAHFERSPITSTSSNVTREGREYFHHEHMEILKKWNIIDNIPDNWWKFTFKSAKGIDFFYFLSLAFQTSKRIVNERNKKAVLTSVKLY